MTYIPNQLTSQKELLKLTERKITTMTFYTKKF